VAYRSFLLCLVGALAVLLSGCMEALQPISGGDQQIASGWPTSPSQPPRPPLLNEPAPPTPAVGSTVAPTFGQYAPEPPTAAPTSVAIPVQQPTTDQSSIILPAPVARSNEERWRAQQLNRVVFASPQRYNTSNSQLWWFDPVNEQHILLGSFSGDFEAQAVFVLAAQGVDALELPYQVNRLYGLTALSPALLDRIRAAGYGDWIETYVIMNANVSSQ
jgi:hypothetical protein